VKLRDNIIKMYLLKGVTWFYLIMPIIVIFFQENNLSIFQIMILQAGYSLSVAFFEIPSGFLADIYGRKNSLIFGSILTFIGYVMFSIFSGFNEYLFAEILLGIGGSLMSGSDSAIIYDTLLELGEDEDYAKIEGKNYAIGNFSEALAGILGGFFAISSIYLPVYIQSIVVFFSIPLAYSLIEPKSSYKLSKSLSSIIEIVKDTLINNTKLRWYIIFSSSMGVASLSMAWFVQPFLTTISMPLLYFGIIWAFLNIISGISSYYSYLFKNYNLLIYIPLLTTISFICLGFNISILGLIFISLVYFIRGIITPNLKNLINLNTTSERRATVLSLRSFMIRISFALIAPILGYITDLHEISYVFFTLATIVGFTSLLAAYKLNFN
jgi:MFS family permease